MKLPYVIDNQTHILVDILKGLLSERKGRSLDVATAYFTVGGFGLLKEGLTDLGNFSLLLGAEPRSGEQVGLRPDSGVVKGLIRKDLEELPFDENTLRLVEDLDMPGKRGRESFVDRVLVESNKKLGETLEGKTKAKLDEIGGRKTSPSNSQVQKQMASEKKIVMIAGPNGAGKTTFALEFLPREADCPDFINVDLIAAGLSPLNPDRAAIRAGRLMLEEIKRRVRDGNSFAFETTLSGRHYARMIPRWRAAGYHVKLIFLNLPTADLAVARVASRVAQGGHNVPESVIRRRFDSGLRNFHNLYRTLVNSWALYDNSGTSPRLIVWGENP